MLAKPVGFSVLGISHESIAAAHRGSGLRRAEALAVELSYHAARHFCGPRRHLATHHRPAKSSVMGKRVKPSKNPLTVANGT